MFGSLLGGLLGGLGGIFGGSNTADAARQNQKAYKSLLNQGTAAIDTGNTQATGYLNDANDLWKGLAGESGGLSGLNLYGDALGVNGASGTQRAQDAFTTSPGYQFSLDQGLDALNRTASARGSLNSGQTGLDTIKYATGLANNEYGNWLNNLSGYGGQQAGIYTGAIGGQAGTLADLGNLATNTANSKVDLLTNYTNGMTGANNQIASGQNQQLTGGLAGLGKGLGSLFGGFL